jgi:hypothetical protein
LVIRTSRLCCGKPLDAASVWQPVPQAGGGVAGTADCCAACVVAATSLPVGGMCVARLRLKCGDVHMCVINCAALDTVVCMSRAGCVLISRVEHACNFRRHSPNFTSQVLEKWPGLPLLKYNRKCMLTSTVV